MLSSWLLLLAPWTLEWTAPEPGIAVVEPRGPPRPAATFGLPAQQQVRIERRTIIRVAPHAARRWPPRPGNPGDYRERAVGKCLPLGGIAAVGVDRDERLLLFMRDRQVIGAQLEKSCHAQDFYSGFYIDRSADGRLCSGRDMLRARSGASCSISRMRKLLAPGR